MTPDRKGCVDKNECLDSPCRNGGVCLNQDPRIRYRCICPDGFWGENCELVQEGQKLKLGMGALAAILVCLLIILSEYTVVSSCRTLLYGSTPYPFIRENRTERLNRIFQYWY
jgi:hypothetical protein